MEPLEQDTFIASAKGTYEEIGTVIAVDPALFPPSIVGMYMGEPTYAEKPAIEVGDKVYFDSWLAARYPTGEGDKAFWLVNYDDIRAVQKPDKTA